MKKHSKKRPAAKPRQAKPKASVKAVTKAKAKPKAAVKAKAKPKPKKSKPVVSAKPSPTPAVTKMSHSELEELRRIEIALAEAENGFAGDTGQPVTLNHVLSVMLDDITELLDELIVTASPKLASTVSRLAYVLCEVMPGLQAVSKRADIALCRKCGVTFGWDRQAEAERAVRSGKYQKSIAVS